MVFYGVHLNENHTNHKNNTSSLITYVNMRILAQVFAWGQDLTFLGYNIKVDSI
jgi:hypothetical protein